MLLRIQPNKMKCRLCPRKCEKNRKEQRGYCGQTEEIRVARAALHEWEEPCISGKSGSGAVFFSGCPLHCIFCQNSQIANGRLGVTVTPERLAEIFLELQEQGANNINLVTPTQFVPQIIRAVERSRREGLHLPIVYNTGSYEQVDTIRALEGIVEIYLPDLKYYAPELSAAYANAPDYFSCASRAIREMVRQTGMPCFYRKKQGIVWRGLSEERRIRAKEYNQESQKEQNESELLMAKGTIVRHLLLPTHLADSRHILRYLHETYGNQIYISMMSQYTPVVHQERYTELNDRVSEEAYQNLVSYAQKLGVEQAFFQEGEVAKESFIPLFDGTGIKK